ncbi:adenylate cyclase [Candidatus Photodesmus blepharus]|uniref:Adenylate cyclase n=1 Tax=Candidatus Photodesmus blepharonis TaxID=1179155 RepID=A0A084CNI6_9GAMM|nr:adenylate cyclase [Candidatus Photodesmus blepharus]
MQAYMKTLVRRLDDLNQQRIERALLLMNLQSRNVFHLVPALLHFNHPAIPGYYSPDVPCGVYGLELNKIQQQFIRDVQLRTDQKFESTEAEEILGLYAMGSTSSIAQNTSSDLDIWVSVSPKMSNEQRNNLTNKCLLITDWAKKQEVEVNFFLMDEEYFRNDHSKEMAVSNSRSSQHLLLLDEFYRSAVRLAGKRLLWQIVPPNMDAYYDEYVENLYDLGYIRSSEWLDFGKLTYIPAEEYFSSNLWQLYKSIDAPYKSVLKATLLEAYSWEHPHTRLLSIDVKRHFFAKSQDLHEMDPYYLMLQKITNYLKCIGDDSRLHLIRRCFYLKTHEKLSYKPKIGSDTWRRKVLVDIISEWNWNETTVRKLDNHQNWQAEQARTIQNALLDALMLSYHYLIQCKSIGSTINPRDVSMLAHKLYTAFELLPDEVKALNSQSLPNPL